LAAAAVASARPAARWDRPGEFFPVQMLEKTAHGAQQARGAGGFVAAGLPLSQQRLQIVAANACQRQAAMVQPLN